MVDPFQLIETYGLDSLRYFLMREVVFGQDGSYSETALVQRLNSDLANDLGNLVQRVLSFIYKNAEGKIPQPHGFSAEDREMLAKAAHLHDLLRDDMEVQALQTYCVHIWEVVGEANRYVDSQKPWSLRKSSDPQDHQRMGTILYVLCEVIRHVAVYVQPVIPESASKILDQLGQDSRTFEGLQIPLVADTPLSEPSPLFPRIEKVSA